MCNKAKCDRSPIKHSLNITKTPSRQNEIAHFDIWYSQRGVMFLTSIDRLTKYATAHRLSDRYRIVNRGSIVNAIKIRVTDNELDVVAIKQFFYRK